MALERVLIHVHGLYQRSCFLLARESTLTSLPQYTYWYVLYHTVQCTSRLHTYRTPPMWVRVWSFRVPHFQIVSVRRTLQLMACVLYYYTVRTVQADCTPPYSQCGYAFDQSESHATESCLWVGTWYFPGLNRAIGNACGSKYCRKYHFDLTCFDSCFSKTETSDRTIRYRKSTHILKKRRQKKAPFGKKKIMLILGILFSFAPIL